jgi:hypothetical protein
MYELNRCGSGQVQRRYLMHTMAEFGGLRHWETFSSCKSFDFSTCNHLRAVSYLMRLKYFETKRNMLMLAEGETYVTKLSRVAKLKHDFDRRIGHACHFVGLPT